MAHVLRVPKFDLAALLAQQNPHIDLDLELYEHSTRNFLKAVSHYTHTAQAEITRRKNAHTHEKKRLAEKIQSHENETNVCKVKELELIAELDREREERKKAELSAVQLERQLATIREQCSQLDAEIEQKRAVVMDLRRERDRERSILETYASRTAPELLECERRLQCYVEGIEKDKVLLRFTHIDKGNPDREFSVVIDVSSSVYKVPTTSPALPTLPILLDELNETRDVYAFIKQVRQAFEHLVMQGR
ncbi:chromosome segregation protein Spc25-domain-containing protein [Cytidiella melzeri]|nr:chromosome segregation protein Spc25-domain-containing protein [Cytidiella melzeri]